MKMSEPALDNCVSKHDFATVNENSSKATGGCQGFVSENTRTLDQSQKMGPLATKIVDEAKLDQEIIYYYGIHIPGESQVNEHNDELHVYLDKAEALKVVKKHKKARFKVFRSKQEAIEFAVHGCEFEAAMSSTPEQSENVDSIQLSSVPLIGEKPSLFKGPKAQELVQLRKAIEFGDLQAVKSMVWNNPRYLVSSGDTPAILQEGSRYNALHVAAKAKNATMSEFIIQTVGNPAFVGLLYGDDDEQNCADRASILLDLYLNTPDKGLNETPLHFAAKFGAVGVVETLVSCRQCDRTPRNKFGQTPKDIVCSRVTSPDSSLKKEIMDLLEEHYYIPVWRSEDNSVQPTVGTPFKPSAPPDVDCDLLSPRLEMHALAGPMNGADAAIFRKKWKTPPRIKTGDAGNLGVSSAVSLQDTEKGLERVGRSLAKEFKTGWAEYWPFLRCFANLSSTEGLQMLEQYLKDRYLQAHSFTVEGDETKEDSVLNISSCDSSTGDGGISPMTDLCLALKACSLSDTGSSNRGTFRIMNVKRGKEKSVKNIPSGDAYVDADEETFLNALSNPALSPLLYVEKSCQVFAKRIADYLINMVENMQDIQTVDLVFDMLSAEMRHLQVLVNSYMEDNRFASVDFQFIHSRISSLVACKLSQLENMDIELISCGLNNVLFYHKVADPCSSDEEDNFNSAVYRPERFTSRHKKLDISVQNHVRCIAQQVMIAIRRQQETNEERIHKMDSRVDSESECKSVWSNATKCSCLWQTQNFVRTRKGASFKRNRGLKSVGVADQGYGHDTRTLLNSVSKRLNFEGNCDPSYGEDFHNTDEPGGKGVNGMANGVEIGFHNELDQTSDSDDNFSFCTATSSPREINSDDEMLSADEGEALYIEGDRPNKMDLSVLQAIEGCEITPDKYPNIFWWRSLVLQHPAEERSRWDTPATVRQLRRRREQSGPMFHGSPVMNRDRQAMSSPNAWHRIAGRYAPNKFTV
ncbi:ankyrin repeat and LEM domain-containing protein 2 homolog [Anabrus simplex]|uniref:ankyrin repeat and LEM domain-containing protein 2 homolog n=1 Tax=Anabrus simplex TaxID=316456 RepID=UPI0035A39ACF